MTFHTSVVFVHFGSLLCLPCRGNQISSLSQRLPPCRPGFVPLWSWAAPQHRERSLAMFWEPPLPPSHSRCCLEPLELCLRQPGTMGCPFHCCSALMWHVRSGFKTHFITWECMRRTQSISSHTCHFWCWQSNKINAIFLFTSVFGSPSLSVLSCPGWPRSQTILTMLLPPNVPAYCSDNSSKF